MEKAQSIIDQEDFKWYQLSPSIFSLDILADILDKVKTSDNPNFYAELEDKIDYSEFTGCKWIYRDEDGKIFSIIICLPKSIEMMILKDNDKGMRIIESVENAFTND